MKVDKFPKYKALLSEENIQATGNVLEKEKIWYPFTNQSQCVESHRTHYTNLRLWKLGIPSSLDKASYSTYKLAIQSTEYRSRRGARIWNRSAPVQGPTQMIGVGHVVKDDKRIPKVGRRTVGGQGKRCKDSLRLIWKRNGIDVDLFEVMSSDRVGYRSRCFPAVERKRLAQLRERPHLRSYRSRTELTAIKGAVDEEKDEVKRDF